MKEDLYARLAELADTYSAGEVPQDKRGEYITFQRSARVPHHHLTGVPDLQEETYEIHAYGDTEAEASALGDQVRYALDGVSSEIGAEWAVVENVLDDFDIPPSGGERPKHRTMLTVRVFWHESI
jgi:hypothetical protein